VDRLLQKLGSMTTYTGTSSKLVSVTLTDFDFCGSHFDQRTLNILNDNAPGEITYTVPWYVLTGTSD